MTRINIKTICMSIATAMVTMLSACYSDFEPDIESTPVVCLNSDIIAGEKVTVSVTRTWRYSEGSPVSGLDIVLRDADVSIVVNERDTYSLTCTEIPGHYAWDEPEYVYVSEYVAREGDRIEVSAVSEAYGEAHGSVVVPSPAKIDDVTFNVRNLSVRKSGNRINANFDLSLGITFTDPADAVNYYKFGLRSESTDSYIDENNLWHGPNEYMISQMIDFSQEPIFSEHVNALESIVGDTYGYTVFSDRQISGKSYTLHIILPSCSYSCEDSSKPCASSLIVRLSQISTDYYRYMMSLWATTEGINGALGGVGLGNPVWEHSNVSTGAGILSASAAAEFPIPLRSFVEE